MMLKERHKLIKVKHINDEGNILIPETFWYGVFGVVGKGGVATTK